MRNCLLFLWFIVLLWSCHSLDTREFVSVADVIKGGKEKQKASLVYIYSSDCMACELFELKALKDSRVVDYINDHFILYKADIGKNREFNKILYTYGIPLVCIIEGDEFKNVFYPSTDADLFLFSLENYKSVPFHASLSTVTGLKGKGEDIVTTINTLLKLVSRMERKTISRDSVRLYLEKSVATCPYFYNQYLLSQNYGRTDSAKVMAIYKNLAEQVTGMDELIYGEELKQLRQWYYKINPENKGEIKFEHSGYDFGSVKAGEKVSHSFPFVNKGQYPLLIYSVNATCGCTVPHWTRYPIMQGACDSIRVELTVRVPGKIQKSIQVVTNSEEKVVELTISANVK